MTNIPAAVPQGVEMLSSINFRALAQPFVKPLPRVHPQTNSVPLASHRSLSTGRPDLVHRVFRSRL